MCEFGIGGAAVSFEGNRLIELGEFLLLEVHIFLVQAGFFSLMITCCHFCQVMRDFLSMEMDGTEAAKCEYFRSVVHKLDYQHENCCDMNEKMR